MTRSLSVRIHEVGGPEVMQLEEVHVADPQPHEVTVRHTAIGLNFIDTYHRSGLYPLELPAGIGLEAAGLVEVTGSAVTDVKAGDRVAYASRPVGSYAERRNIRADLLVPVPAEVTDEQAAAVLLKGMTVEYLVRRTFAVQKGDDVLLHAAAGGVGLLACQWLRYIGARTIGTVSTEEKATLARQHGCDDVLVFKQGALVPAVRGLTHDRGVAVVYDSVGRDTFMESLQCLRPRGLMVAFGNASGAPAAFDPLLLSQFGSLYLTRPTLMDYTRTRAELLESARTVFDLVSRGVLKVEVNQRWPLTRVVDAHRALHARQTTGSSVLLP